MFSYEAFFAGLCVGLMVGLVAGVLATLVYKAIDE